MQNLGGQTKSIMVFSEVSCCLNCPDRWEGHMSLLPTVLLYLGGGGGGGNGVCT